MQGQNETGRDYFHRIDPLRVDNAEDIELAFLLQNASCNDPDLLKRLIGNYTGDLYRWVGALLFFQQGVEPTSQEILVWLEKVYIWAITHVDQFQGQASVFIWLFGIAYQAVNNQSLIEWIKLRIRKKHQANELSTLPEEIDWRSLETLPEKLRNPLLLRHLFDLGLPDIANILDLQMRDVHLRLVEARKRLLPRRTTSHMDAPIQAYVDGLLEDDPDGLTQLMQHLEICEICQPSVTVINALEKSLAESLNQRWGPPIFDDKALDALGQSVLLQIQLSRTRWKPNINLRQAMWIVGLAAVFVVLAVVFIRLTPVEREFAHVEDPTITPELPPVINIQPELASSPDGLNFTGNTQYVAPSFSVDGMWAVFALISADQDSPATVLPTIKLYNRETKTIKLISESTAELNPPWVWWDLAPSISGDGRLIAYVSSTNDPNVVGDPCVTAIQNDCLDIFLYDRDTGSTRRLTQAVSGGPADGDSLAPSISADGNWVAFYSVADNLVDSDRGSCQRGGTSVICLYIYICNVQSNKMERIPIRNYPSAVVNGANRISISVDGRYVGFTVTPTSVIESISPESPSSSSAMSNTINDPASKPAETLIHRGSEAVIYDQQTRNIEFENQEQDGTRGNGASASPVLSADGRYVAFASSSSNLVSADFNNYSDVFVRDRETGSVEIVSISSEAIQGNSHSGMTPVLQQYTNLDISDDARYVIFASTASNLAQDITNLCDPNTWNVCNILYVHDRETGSTEMVSANNDGDSIIFPEISTDGRWLSFMQFSYNCRVNQGFCSRVILFDRQKQWMTNLDFIYRKISQLPWSFSTSLSPSWDALPISAFGLSPDGKIVAVGGYDSIVRVWLKLNWMKPNNRVNPDLYLKTRGVDQFTTIAISKDDKWLAAGTNTGEVYIWDLSSGEIIYELSDQTHSIKKILFLQDGERLAISTLFESAIWSIGDRELVKEISITLGAKPVYAIDISSDGNLLATAQEDGTVWIRTLPGGKVIGRLGGLQVVVTGLALSPDGSMLAACSREGKINVWEIGKSASGTTTFKLLKIIATTEDLGTLVFSNNNQYLAGVGRYGEVTLWSVLTGKMDILPTSRTGGLVSGVAFSQDDSILSVMSDNEVVFWGIPLDYEPIYYFRSAEDTFIDSPPLPPSTANDIPELFGHHIARGNLTIDQAAILVNFTPFVPTHLPEDIYLMDATVNEDGSLWLRYAQFQQQSYSVILNIFEQAIGMSTPKMTIGSGAVVFPIRFAANSGQVTAEYVKGDWNLYQGFTPPDDNSSIAHTTDIWQWINSSSSQRLRWLQSGILIALYYQVNQSYLPVIPDQGQSNLPATSSLLSQSDLIQIADGMKLYNLGGSVNKIFQGNLESMLWRSTR